MTNTTASASAASTTFHLRLTSDRNCHFDRNTDSIWRVFGEISLHCLSIMPSTWWQAAWIAALQVWSLQAVTALKVRWQAKTILHWKVELSWAGFLFTLKLSLVVVRLNCFVFCTLCPPSVYVICQCGVFLFCFLSWLKNEHHRVSLTCHCVAVHLWP